MVTYIHYFLSGKKKNSVGTLCLIFLLWATCCCSNDDMEMGWRWWWWCFKLFFLYENPTTTTTTTTDYKLVWFHLCSSSIASLSLVHYLCILLLSLSLSFYFSPFLTCWSTITKGNCTRDPLVDTRDNNDASKNYYYSLLTLVCGYKYINKYIYIYIICSAVSAPYNLSNEFFLLPQFLKSQDQWLHTKRKGKKKKL